MSAPLLRRAEDRIPLRMFVKLSDPATGTFEITSTIDVSCHGARVVSRNEWHENQDVFVRSIRGTLDLRARVARCEVLAENSYVLGLELYAPKGDWTKTGKLPTAT